MGSILKQFRHTVKLGTTRLPRCVFPILAMAYGEILLSENKEEEALAAYIDAGEHAEAQQRIRELCISVLQMLWRRADRTKQHCFSAAQQVTRMPSCKRCN